MATMNHGRGMEYRGSPVKCGHCDETDPGHKVPVEMGTTSKCAPKKGVNITGGQANYGFHYETPGSKGHNGFPGYPVP